MRLSIIVAVAENGVIGRDGDLPWHLPDDLRRFKQTTMGHTLLMGRRTCDSIGRALPGRRSIVLSRDPTYRPPTGVTRAATFEEALAIAADAEELFVIGGATVYEVALPRADRLLLTLVHGQVEGDARFPHFNAREWRLVDEERHARDERHAFAFTVRTFERRKNRADDDRASTKTIA